MTNENIVQLFKLTASLLELHDENVFKIKSYNSAVYNLDKLNIDLINLSLSELEKIEGVGKSLAQKINSILQTGTFEELSLLISATPEGVLEMLNIKGIGPKKVRTLWKDLGLETVEALLQACEDGKVAALKGFGEKTQDTIKQGIMFSFAQKGKLFYSEAEIIASEIKKLIVQHGFEKVEFVGELRRKTETVEVISLLVQGVDIEVLSSVLARVNNLEYHKSISGSKTWRGLEQSSQCKVEIHLSNDKDFAQLLFLLTGSEAHLKQIFNDKETLMQFARKNTVQTEFELFDKMGLQYIEPELREGLFELELAKKHQLPVLLELKDLRGILHNHSTYSDGKHTLEQMAVYCKELGYEYLGICDHSKSATYASGLFEEKVALQHHEIEVLNKKLAPFKIFKGIESDILGDGSLDYDDYVLKSFDFIVASIHSNLKMDKNKATQRLLKAIENPYTTMLGHPTGRLLLRREGYPIDHQLIIDACAANDVVIEINASPWRLDLDWRWVNYAIEKGVKLSINPDAHEMEGYHDMYYGVCVGRKGGLTKEMTFNALGVNEVEKYFLERKKLKNIQ